MGRRNGNGSAITAIREAGLSIPEDISVAGYDNTDLAPLSSISLTSVDHSRHSKGILVARLLLERIESGRTERRLEMLKPRLANDGPTLRPSPASLRTDQALSRTASFSAAISKCDATAAGSRSAVEHAPWARSPTPKMPEKV